MANKVIVPMATAIFVVSLLDRMLLNGAVLWYSWNRMRGGEHESRGRQPTPPSATDRIIMPQWTPPL